MPMDYDEEMDCLAREIENLEITDKSCNVSMYQLSSTEESKTLLTLMMILVKRKLYHLWRNFSSIQTSNHWVVFLLVPGMLYLKKHSHILDERPVRSLHKFSAQWLQNLHHHYGMLLKKVMTLRNNLA